MFHLLTSHPLAFTIWQGLNPDTFSLDNIFIILENLISIAMFAAGSLSVIFVIIGGMKFGVFTPTEAFAAIRVGATHLKLFPAEAASPAVIKAWKAVLPKAVKIYAVGGVTPDNMAEWLAAGTSGFGIGSSIFKPGMSAAAVREGAGRLVSAWMVAKEK